ncbi:MAG: zinc-dependent alcohol dehydrogenase [Bryobacteraceae bacterium]
MRAVELTGPRRLQLASWPDLSAPPPGHIQVRVTHVGVCGSDMHYFSEGGIGDVPSEYPMVLGHEPTGRIAAVGAGVTGWARGDPVIVEPALYCYHCEFCLSGRHNVCASLRFLSQPDEPGLLRDFANLPATNVLPVPEGLSLREATLAEPLAIILHSMRFAALRPGETAVVFGAGPIGLLTIAVVKIAGASRIWAVEPVAHRREMALRLGADAALDPHAIDAAAAILDETGGRGVDAAIDCAARNGSINQAIRAVCPGGRVVMTGIPVEREIAIEYHVLRRKEAAFLNVRRSCHETPRAAQLLAERPERFVPMLTHTRPLERAQAAFELLEGFHDGVGKLVMEVD